MTSRLTALAAIVVFALAVSAARAQNVSHDDDQFEQDRQPRYEGPGFRAAQGGSPPMTFPAQDVELLSWVPLPEFDPDANSGNDCWGYASPSGREYAIIGVSTGTGFVEVSDPANAQIVDVLPGPNSLWRDMKTYQHYAYAVSEGGAGIQVFDLSDIDNGVVTQINTVTTGGRESTHNVAINEESGFLYRAGGGGSPPMGLRIYDLSDPSNPQFVGEWNDRYCHDAQVVNWTEGTFAGREIAFCFAQNTSGGGSPAVDILDVTDKSSVVRIESVTYSTAGFSHQGWLSPDRRYLYLDDELDEVSFGIPTTTRVIEVRDLHDAVEVATFTNGLTSIDHNLYTRGNLIVAANYRSGLRVFDATDPVAPVEVGFFDTYPDDDNRNFNGLWSNYPFFPSGTVIGSDLEKGLFVWRLLGLADCNDNGRIDSEDIRLGFSEDCNLNGTPDECEADEDCNSNGVRDICEAATGTSPDCNANGVPDECDILSGTSEDLDSNGSPDECCAIPVEPVAGPIETSNRYLSLRLPESSQLAAIRVTLVDLPAQFASLEGTHMWVGQPFPVSQAADRADATPPTFLAARLTCTPALLDWSALGEVQVFGPAVVPGATYDVKSISQECVAVGVTRLSQGLEMTTGTWGDVVGDCDMGACTPPDGLVAISTDVLAIIDRFRGALPAVPKSHMDLAPDEPDQRITVGDILASIDGFRAAPFSFSGPQGCP